MSHEMPTTRRAAVFDCNVYAQALINPRGPAGGSVAAAQWGRVTLFISDYILQEIRELPAKLPPKLDVTSDRVERMIIELAKFARLIESVPEDFQYSRDTDDAHYVNLAIVTKSFLVVSRDRDLLELMSIGNAEGQHLLARYPDFRVVTPPQFLRILETSPT
jgi:putative PIN family toxin of toxin-antitoxin system